MPRASSSKGAARWDCSTSRQQAVMLSNYAPVPSGLSHQGGSGGNFVHPAAVPVNVSGAGRAEQCGRQEAPVCASLSSSLISSRCSLNVS